MPTPLDTLIRQEIAVSGPISVARYMDLCLAHPQYGYYMTRDPLGAAGDFTTAPEISQMFGEIIGAWLMEAWQNIGSPARFTLLECGPGRGTLMADILRVGTLRQGFIQGADVVLLETSPVLRAIQSETLTAHAHRHVTSMAAALNGDVPLIAVGNEFFDALPVHQYVRDDAGWRERLIGVDHDDQFIFGLGPVVSLPHAPDIVFYEASPASESLFQQLTSCIKTQGGACIFVDYGTDNRADMADTLQAVRGHQKVNVLAACGESDLTAHVNFGVLQDIAVRQGLDQVTIQTQRDFLIDNGLLLRQAALAHQNPAKAEGLQGQVHRLTDPTQMGELFRVITARSACNLVQIRV